MKDHINKTLNWEHLVSVVGGVFLSLGVVFFFFQNSSVLSALAPEFVSIGITILIVERIVERQQENEKNRERVRELIRNMGSKSNDFAITAVRALRTEGWLLDGSLEGKDFGWAELHKADLSRAEMTGANFTKAKLSKTNLAGAVLKDANLTGAELEGANIALTDFEGSSMNVEQLKSAILLIGTIMPNGTKLKDLGEKITGVDWERESYPEGPTFEDWLITQEGENGV